MKIAIEILSGQFVLRKASFRFQFNIKNEILPK